MAINPKNIEELLKLANDYGVAENPIILELISKYNEQKQLLKKVQSQIRKDGLTCTKEYVKGRENLTANPLLDIFQKHQDSSSKTLGTLSDAIIKFGTTPPKQSRLQKFMEDE